MLFSFRQRSPSLRRLPPRSLLTKDCQSLRRRSRMLRVPKPRSPTRTRCQTLRTRRCAHAAQPGGSAAGSAFSAPPSPDAPEVPAEKPVEPPPCQPRPCWTPTATRRLTYRAWRTISKGCARIWRTSSFSGSTRSTSTPPPPRARCRWVGRSKLASAGPNQATQNAVVYKAQDHVRRADGAHLLQR